MTSKAIEVIFIVDNDTVNYIGFIDNSSPHTLLNARRDANYYENINDTLEEGYSFVPREVSLITRTYIHHRHVVVGDDMYIFNNENMAKLFLQYIDNWRALTE